MTCENSQHKGWGMMHGQQEELRIIQFWSMSLTSWPFWEPDVENRTKRQILLTVKHKSLVQSVWVIKISDLYSMHFILLCLFRNFYWISKLLLDYLLNVFFKTCSLFFWAHLFYLKTKKSLQSIKHLIIAFTIPHGLHSSSQLIAKTSGSSIIINKICRWSKWGNLWTNTANEAF